MNEASELSFRVFTNCPNVGLIVFQNACGKVMYLNIWVLVRLKDRATSNWLFGIAKKPERIISDCKPPKFKESPKTATQNGEICSIGMNIGKQ